MWRSIGLLFLLGAATMCGGAEECTAISTSEEFAWARCAAVPGEESHTWDAAAHAWHCEHREEGKSAERCSGAPSKSASTVLLQVAEKIGEAARTKAAYDGRRRRRRSDDDDDGRRRRAAQTPAPTPPQTPAPTSADPGSFDKTSITCATSCLVTISLWGPDSCHSSMAADTGAAGSSVDSITGLCCVQTTDMAAAFRFCKCDLSTNSGGCDTGDNTEVYAIKTETRQRTTNNTQFAQDVLELHDAIRAEQKRRMVSLGILSAPGSGSCIDSSNEFTYDGAGNPISDANGDPYCDYTTDTIQKELDEIVYDYVKEKLVDPANKVYANTTPPTNTTCPTPSYPTYPESPNLKKPCESYGTAFNTGDTRTITDMSDPESDLLVSCRRRIANTCSDKGKQELFDPGVTRRRCKWMSCGDCDTGGVAGCGCGETGNRCDVQQGRQTTWESIDKICGPQVRELLKDTTTTTLQGALCATSCNSCMLNLTNYPRCVSSDGTADAVHPCSLNRRRRGTSGSGDHHLNWQSFKLSMNGTAEASNGPQNMALKGTANNNNLHMLEIERRLNERLPKSRWRTGIGDPMGFSHKTFPASALQIYLYECPCNTTAGYGNGAYYELEGNDGAIQDGCKYTAMTTAYLVAVAKAKGNANCKPQTIQCLMVDAKPNRGESDLPPWGNSRRRIPTKFHGACSTTRRRGVPAPTSSDACTSSTYPTPTPACPAPSGGSSDDD